MVGPRPGKRKEAGGSGAGWRPGGAHVSSLQRWQPQQLRHHQYLAGLSDLASWGHLIHDCVNLVEVEHQLPDFAETLI